MTATRVLITGVSSGLGLALANALLDDGATVVGTSRREPAGFGDVPAFRFVPGDLSQLDTIDDLVDRLLDGDPRLDLVILNAGALGEIRDLASTSLDELRARMDLNVWSNKLLFDALLARDALPRQLVAISSGSARNGSGGWGPYSISKAALNLLLRTYAHEHPDVHVTCLAPGLIETPLIEALYDLEPDDRYPAVGRIVAARGTEAMQSPATAARRVLDALPRLLSIDSGAYIDIRELG